jgi:Spy/CpxP family protein refolding chaperone
VTRLLHLAIVLAPVLAPTLANAQPPAPPLEGSRPPGPRDGMMRGPRPWWDGQVAREINLTDAQTKQIRQVQRDFRQRMFETRALVDKAEAEVQAAFNEDPVDQNKANDAINRLAAARGELTKAVSQMDLKLRMVLTAKQWQDLNERQRGWPGPGGRRRSPPPNSQTSPTTQQK